MPAVMRTLLTGLVATGLFALGPGVASAATLPGGFEDSQVTAVGGPTALAFTPDERLLVTAQGGQLRVVQGGTLQTTPALDLVVGDRVCSDFERGLLGVTVDPDFASNRFIYVYYTFKKNGSCEYRTPRGPVNRVSRFTLSESNVASNQTVLIDNIPSWGGNHNAGDLQFGRDGFLYVSVGDGGCDYLASDNCAGNNDAARDPNVLLGKVLRITRDGRAPMDNPNAQSGDECALGATAAGRTCQETFASGLRNPFRLAFDPNAAGTRFFINDVGQNAWEEIDEGEAGADYGWNVREGAHCRNGAASCGQYDDPIHEYSHASDCKSITGGAFVPRGVWPESFDDAYLFADYVCGKIFALRPAPGGGYTASDFVTGLGESSAVALTFGPDGSLYYTSYRNGGEVRRINYTGSGNRRPAAAATASPASGGVPLTVRFDAAASTDPDAGDRLTYLWDFGDGATAETGDPAITHVYATVGTYEARLRVRDQRGAVSDPLVLRIDAGNTAPRPVIELPTATRRFSVGQRLTLRGSATDAEDGALAGSALSWKVLLHHNNDHTHPLLDVPGTGQTRLTAPPPEDLAAARRSYLELQLTATDSRGLATTVTQELRPRLVRVKLVSKPRGLRLRVNGRRVRAPNSITSWAGWRLRLDAPAQTRAGRRWSFVRWSHRRRGRRASHSVKTPSSRVTYTATFRPRRR